MKIALFGGSLLKRIKQNKCFDELSIGTEYWYISPISAEARKLEFNKEEYLCIELSSFRLNNNNSKIDENNNEGDSMQNFNLFCEMILKKFENKKIVLISSILPKYYERKGVICKINKQDSLFNRNIEILEQIFVSKCKCITIEPSRSFFLSRNAFNESEYYFDYENVFYSYLKYSFKILLGVEDECICKMRQKEVLYERLALFFGKITYRKLEEYMNCDDPADIVAYYSDTQFVERNKGALAEISLNPKIIVHYAEICKLYLNFFEILKPDTDLTILDISMIKPNFYIVNKLVDKMRSKLDIDLFSKKHITVDNFVWFYNCYMKRRDVKENMLFPCIPELVDIWGSCISRTIVNYSDNRLNTNVYYMHINPISYNKRARNINLDRMDLNSWEDKGLCIQLEGTAEKYYLSSQAEWLFVDFYSLVSDDVWSVEDRLITTGYETGCNYFQSKPVPQKAIYNMYTPEEIYPLLKPFVDFCHTKYGRKIILFSTVHSIYKRIDNTISIWEDKDSLLRKNEFVSKIEKWFWNQTQCYYLDVAKYYISSDNIIYNMAPYHIDEQLYKDEIKIVNYILQNTPALRKFDAANIEYFIDLKLLAKKQKIDIDISSGNRSVDEYVSRLDVESLIKKKEEIIWSFNSLQYEYG